MDVILLADGEIAQTDNDQARGALCIGLENMWEHLAELQDTMDFLRQTWPHDPIIKAHFTGGDGETEEGVPIAEVEETAVCTHFPGPGDFGVNMM